MRPRRRIIAALTISLAGAAAGWTVAKATARPPIAVAYEPGLITATVERRSIRASIVTRADISAARRVEVPLPTSAESAVVTRIPTPVGEQVGSGSMIAELSGRPLFALEADVPTYRDLRPGDRGPDVNAIQRALANLGWPTSDPSGELGPSTRAAIAAWYRSRGYAPPAPPPEALAALTSATSARQAAADAVLDASDEVALQQSQGAVTPSARRALARTQDDLRQAEADLVAARIGTEAWLPAREVVLVAGLPLRMAEAPKVGPAPDGPLAVLAGGPLIVDARVTAFEAEALALGTSATLDDEATGESWTVAVVALDEVSPPSDDPDATQQTAVRLGFARSPDALEGRNLRLTFERPGSDPDGLVVPIAAVVTGPSGRTELRVARRDDRAVRRVPVDLGLEADGMAAVRPVEPGGLRAGDRVVIGSERPGG